MPIRAESPELVRLARLSLSSVDRFLTMSRTPSPDPRLSYPRFRVLAWIDESQQVSIGALASNQGIARSTASEMVSRMERDRLVLRTDDAQDARSVVIALTPFGRRLVRRRRGELLDAHRALLARLNAADQKAFVDAFETIDRLTRKAVGI